MNEEKNVNLEAEETVEETEEVKESKIKKGLKVVWKYTKKAIPAVVTGIGCFALGRLTKGTIDLPEEVQEAVETVTENVTTE